MDVEWGELSDQADPVEIVEPDLSILKSTDQTTAPLGSVIPFTIEVEHATISSANAYDVVVTDKLPPGLEYVVGSISQPAGALPYDDFSYNPATATLTITWDSFPLTASSTINFDATFVGPAPVTNVANLEWTSLEIDPADPDYIQSDYNDFSTERFFDPPDAAGVNDFGSASSIVINEPDLPSTGFAPNRVTEVEVKEPSRHNPMAAMSLEIPAIGVRMPIVGIPNMGTTWNVSWLWDEAGWLEGTAYPTWDGNTVLTSHVYLSNGLPGPFINLHTLAWNDDIIIHAYGKAYTYNVRETERVLPNDSSVLRHEDYDWITLITCQGYNEALDSYDYRFVVRAVLVDVRHERFVPWRR